VKIDWLRGRMQTDRRLERRQELPEAAFATADEAVAAFTLQESDIYWILALSYCWLSSGHPDPDCFHASPWLGALKHLQSQGLSDLRYGFWDFLSLFQVPRSPDEDTLFREALAVMHHMYACESIAVARLTTVSRGVPPYEDRGWPMLESQVAFSNSQSVVRGSGSGHVVFTLGDVFTSCGQVRSPLYIPPLTHPDDFDTRIDLKKFSANNTDRAHVKRLYKEFWIQGGLGRTASLQYGCGFTDEDIRQLAQLVPRLPQLILIDIRASMDIHFFTEPAVKLLEDVCTTYKVELRRSTHA